MCNDYEQHVAWAAYCRMMQELELGIAPHQSELDLPQADDIRIGDLGPVMRAIGQHVELARCGSACRRQSPKGGPVFNFRSEGRSFSKAKRCLVPATAFFEFTGRKYPEGQAPVRAERRPLHGDCRPVARRRRKQPAGIRHADDRSGR